MALPIELTKADYQNFQQQATQNPEKFWAEQAGHYISWIQPWQQVLSGGFKEADFKWFSGGKLNVCYNCVDRHLEKNAETIAIIWESNGGQDSKQISYKQLHAEVGRFANVLKAQGVQKGDRVCIYMPMIPEVAYALLACARIGAVHSVVFGGFSAQSIAERILDADCKIVITADEGLRGDKKIPLKNNVDAALQSCPQVKTCLIVQRTGGSISWNSARDVWYHEAAAKVGSECAYEIMDAEDPLFILYTSGSTGKPKGMVHTCGGYLVYTAITFQLAFAYQPQEIYWCTADVGWITGHSYIIYGPLCNRATTVIFEGIPTYPDASRCWQIVDKYQINIFYTAPTAVRELRSQGDAWVKKTSRKSLRILGSVGEPINPEAWQWYYEVVGEGRCPIIDTWWQTETGGFMITPFPYATTLKPGSASWPFLGIKPAILTDDGKSVAANEPGNLVIQKPWPGLARTIYGDHTRFIETYFSQFPGYYVTGDGAHCDQDGYYWISGRIDDVIKVSGHRIGTAEVESALVSHPAVAEAAVVGIPDNIKGESIYAFVTLKPNQQPSDALRQTLEKTVATAIGSFAKPGHIQFTPNLPKTRSGKIMRRILRQIATGNTENFGDTSTLSDPTILQSLLSSLSKKGENN